MLGVRIYNTQNIKRAKMKRKGRKFYEWEYITQELSKSNHVHA